MKTFVRMLAGLIGAIGAKSKVANEIRRFEALVVMASRRRLRSSVEN